MQATYLYYDREWEEWLVLYIDHDGKVDEEKTYHTDDYHDARQTQRCIETEIWKDEIARVMTRLDEEGK